MTPRRRPASRRSSRYSSLVRSRPPAVSMSMLMSLSRTGTDGWRPGRHAAYVAAARDTVNAHGGRLQGPTDSDVVAAFDGPARAIRCAGALRDRAADLGIGLGLGVHCGEVDVVDDRVSGIAVDIATALAALAEPRWV